VLSSWGLGIAYQREHYFPLTPDICIVATNPKTNKKKLKRMDIFKNKEQFIFNINIVVANRAHAHVYSNERTELEDLLSVKKTTQK